MEIIKRPIPNTIIAPADKKRIFLLKTSWLVMSILKTAAIAIAMINDTKIARPPVLGIGFLCTFRSFGMSIAPYFVSILPANGVSSRDRIRAVMNVKSIVVIFLKLGSGNSGVRLSLLWLLGVYPVRFEYLNTTLLSLASLLIYS